MFNNPFGSFQDTVAEAKEEREQLDRLLTISTPRERLLVAVIALLLLILAGWVFFGNVTRSVAVEGVLAEPGESVLEGNRSVQALVWFESGVAPNIGTGMPVAIELTLANGDAGRLDGKIAKISALPLTGKLAALEAGAPLSVYRVIVALDESLDLATLAGGKCRLVIEIGRQSPVALLRMRRS